MSTSGASDSIENHGTALDKEKNRVQCKYCDEVVHGFKHLKHHLCGVGGDMVACILVPDDIKVQMKSSLLVKKKVRFLRQVKELHHPDLPRKRNCSPSSETRRCHRKLQVVGNDNSENENLAPKTANPETTNAMGTAEHVGPSQLAHDVEPTPKERSDISIESGNMEYLHVGMKEEVKEESLLIAFKCIGRFFYEAGIDLNSIKLPSFQRMIDAAIRCGTEFKVPKYDEIKGWILESDLKEVRECVEGVKRTWGTTGCSILLDGWTDQTGRSLISFIVDCPQGSIFLRSVDISDAVTDVNALFLLFSRVIEEVGVYNVVQVITNDPASYMEAAGKMLVEKYKHVFWSLCADYCINLILQRIAAMDHVKVVLDEAKAITRFVYSHKLPLALMKRYVRGKELVRTAKLTSVAPFITLENMMCERENLLHMFTSSTWNISTWASKTNGKTICEQVQNPSFWIGAAAILKVTNPLIGVLHQINGSDTAPMGFLYDSMDRVKEEIKKNLGNEEVRYEPYWTIIDDIWDHYLHRPLHSAGYYLNPSLFYSNDFFVDAEVTNGLLFCLVRMIEDQQHQEMVVSQLDAYRAALGGFAEELAIDQRSRVPPAFWWSLHGGQTPELQKLAIRILSQTCSTTARYKLGKGLSEQLHAKGRNCMEQQKFADMEFVHNNLRLLKSPDSKDQTDNFGNEDLNSMDDWIVE